MTRKVWSGHWINLLHLGNRSWVTFHFASFYGYFYLFPSPVMWYNRFDATLERQGVHASLLMSFGRTKDHANAELDWEREGCHSPP